MPITDMTIRDLSQALAKAELSSVEATQAHLERISTLDKKLHTYLKVTEEAALSAARASDARRAKGEAQGTLDGIPMALKDIICTKGIATTCASRILENYIPPYNATCWQKLEDAGAVLLGKVNMDEFAMGSSTESSAFGITRNPFDPDRVPGGSSGGSAAAVAADLAVYSLGTDTGGSVRQPAHFCGVVGIKPTYGRISRFGVIPYASSLDQVGILAKDCADAAIVLEAVSGKDPMDSTSAPMPTENYLEACGLEIRGMRVGIPKEFTTELIQKEILDQLYQAAEKLVSLGAEIEEISLPHSDYALPTYYILASAEMSSNLGRYDGTRYGLRVEADNVQDMFIASRSAGFGAEVKRRIMLGTYALSSGYYDAYYNKTLQVRTLIKQDYDQAFSAGIDCILTPPAPSPAFPVGRMTADPLTMYMQDICTVPVNLAGLPAMVLPAALAGHLPIGLQLIGPAFGESKLFAIGSKLEGPRLLPALD
ncbi:MAG: Asp-tRNA(Asn)/Glu-tRNA(Gln) amidotransferase subunit GatA [Bacillota bacterium]|nr:Asp-tRNA(Asn)/Glu-tRNA(Gln) amidotransferase subunit GatA [Bacillota bacterium]